MGVCKEKERKRYLFSLQNINNESAVHGVPCGVPAVCLRCGLQCASGVPEVWGLVRE